MEIVARAQNRLYGISLIAAPLLLAISTFLWQEGEVGITGGAIQVYSFVFWIPALLGLLTLLHPAFPKFSVWGALLVCWVCIAGNNFGMEGIFRMSVLQTGGGAEQLAAIEAAMGLASVLVLYLPGILFPLTLILIGFLLWRSQAVPPLFAILLCLGAICFPISRIPRIDLLAHLADVLLLIAAGGLGWRFLQGEIKAQLVPGTIPSGDD